MQASRTLRYFWRHQGLRTFRLFRSVDDVVIGSTNHPSSQQSCLYLLNYFRSYSSSSQESENQKLSSDCSIPESTTSKETSRDSSIDSSSIHSGSTTNEDGFDISEIESQIPQLKKTKIQELLVKWYEDIQEAKDNAERFETIQKLIQPKLCSAVDMALRDTAPSEMRVQCLKLLLCQDEDSPLSKKLLNYMANNSQYLRTKVVADIVHLLSVSSSTELRRNTRKNLVLETIKKRWFEIGAKHIVFFMYQLDELFDMRDVCLKNRKLNLNEKAVAEGKNDVVTDSAASSEIHKVPVDNLKLEKRLITLVDELKTKDLARVVTLMGKWRNRSQVLLIALIHRLNMADLNDFSLIQLSNLLFACSILSIHSNPLLDKIAIELNSREISSPPSAASLLSSLSHLRWQDSSLVSKCVGYLSKHVQGLKYRESQKVLRSLANLYALPVSKEEITVITALGQKVFTEAKSSAEKVNTAWCLSVLKLLDRQMAKELLEPSFVQAFDDDKDFQSRNVLQELRGINLSARFELDEYSGPFVDEKILNADSRIEKNAEHGLLVSVLQNALGKFVDLNSYVKVSHTLPGGLYADALMCAGPDGGPRPLADLEKENSAGNLHHLAVQVIPFHSILTSHAMPCGIHQLASRHLRHLGYTAVQIPYSSLRKSQSVLEHVNTIQSSIKKAVCDVPPPPHPTTGASMTSPSTAG